MNLQSLIVGRERLPELAQDCVQVWRVSTARNGLERFAEVLSPDERARADRFHFERDRRSFVVCRGTLRRLLASYTGEDATAIRFDVGLHGKPSLSNEIKGDLRFNVSHSGELALLAFSRHQEIGVDVEFKRPDVDFLGLGETSFSRLEQTALSACAPADRANLFYEYWTCKEAFIKADGRGLSIPLDQFSVTARGKQRLWREFLVTESGNLHPGTRGRILECGKDYAAAVVASSPSWEAQQLDMEFS
jgi:4'-phosphopantetheinyl transferase